jgi:hypothetical protein
VQGASQRFADTFDRVMSMHSLFKENWELFPLTPWQTEDSVTIFVADNDGLRGGAAPLNSSVRIHWRISTDCGQTWDVETFRPRGSTAFPTEPWNDKTMNFLGKEVDGLPGWRLDDEPWLGKGENAAESRGLTTEFNGYYSTIITLPDNGPYLGGSTLWPEGTVVEYFFTAEDSLMNLDTFPNRKALARNSLDLVETDPGREHDRREGWPFEAQVLPCPTWKQPLPVGQNDRILLVDCFGRRDYDLDVDTHFEREGIAVFPQVCQIYRETLDRLGLAYDFYRAGYGATRRSGAGIYSQPCRDTLSGGVIDYTGGMIRRYETSIWLFGEYNSKTLLDSCQVELSRFIDRDGIVFPESANLWIAGDDLCEDEELSDSALAPMSGLFWHDVAGLEPVTGGCPDDEGHAPPYRTYLSGGAGTVLQGAQVCGYWDCPVRHHPDDGVYAEASDPLLVYTPSVHEGECCASYLRHPSGSKVVLSLTGLELFSSVQERDCFAQAILGPSGFDVGIPDPRGNCELTVDVDGGVPATHPVVLYPNRPNPFNPSTLFSFSAPAGAHVELVVYDVAGRRVRVLARSAFTEGGRHEVLWDGRTDDGTLVASGVYFCHLVVGEERQTRKAVVLR